MKNRGVLWLTLTIMYLLHAGCDTKRVYETNIDIPPKGWMADSLLTFPITIQDTSASYSILMNIRNTLNYPYYNLFVHYYLYNPAGIEISSKQLELVLMEPKTGKPYGDGLGDVFDHQFPVASKLHFPNTGTYTIKLKHYMRQDPLPDLVALGIRIEK